MKTIKRRMKTFEYKYGTNIVFRSGNVFTNNGTLTTHFACAVKYFSITKNSNVQKRHYCTFRKCCVIVLINFSHPFFANDELFGFLGDWRQNSTRTMMDFLNSFKSLIKLEQIHTDNNIFKLHYKFTVIILIVFSILLTSKQYFGDPINCDIEYSNKDVINTYCWIYGTYIVKNTLKEDILTGLGPDVDPRQGGPIQDFLYNERNGIITQKYYQWVCLVFCFQALLFYIPRYLWKTWEGGRLRLLAKDLGGPLIPISWSKENKERLISYMLSGNYSHNLYALRFAFCELLNFLNVIGQILLMDWFLTGQFTGYGIAIATYNGINPMTVVFPKLTKCTYYRFGPSGTVENRDAICVLPLNIVNEKLFLFLWFWFLFLSLVSLYELIYRSAMLLFPRIRMYLLMAHARFLSRKNALVITKKISFGDFFFLYQLGKNLNTLVYKDLLTSIANVLMDKSSLPYNPEITLPV